MYCLTAVARPKPDNPEHGVVSESFVVCWIVSETEEQALKIAERDIEASDWDLIEFDQISDCDDETYAADDPSREYYDLAKIDQTVYVYHNCPMYPVYYFELQIKKSDSAGSDDSNDSNGAATEARAWILNEVACNEHDVFEPDFWSGKRLARAMNIVYDTMSDNGYSVVSVLKQHPVCPVDLEEDQKFYESAEEDGLCVILVHDLAH